MTDVVLSSLIKRRAEVAAEAKALDATLRRLLNDIEHLDGAIRTYDPAYRAPKLRLTRAHRVAMSRTALAILRQAKAPMSVRDIALAVMEAHGKDRTDGKLVKAVTERVRWALIRQRKIGVLRTVQGEGNAGLWEVAG